jgi:hypothetical protein
MVLRVVYETLTEVFLKSFVMNLVSLPAYVNFAHFDLVFVLQVLVLGGMSIIDVSYLFSCRMCLMIFLSFSLLVVLR